MSMLFDELKLFADDQPHQAALNMGIDEALLRSAQCPIMRVYQWSAPAISFGYSMCFHEAVRHFGDRFDYVRRWTGGGMVAHGEDWTYSLIVPKTRLASHWSPSEWYGRVHGELAAALNNAGISAELAVESASGFGGACFERPVSCDVMRNGQKLAGAAMRYSSIGLLLQGSVQGVPVPGDFDVSFAQRLACRMESRAALPKCVATAAEQLSREKYGTEAWLRRR
ncbi:MAG: lipoate--protein ligase family protein [Verrucomicrobiales bacterium]